MSLDVRFLLFFVAIDPNLSGVFLGSNQFGLLVDFVQQLLALDVILFLKGLLLDLQCVCFTFYLRQLLLLFVEFALVCFEHFITLLVGFFDGTILPLEFFEIIPSLLPHIITHLQVLVRIFEVLLEPHEIFLHALRVDF